MTREHKPHGTSPKKNPSQGKRKLKIIGKELPDLETDEQFQANWKITKAKEEELLLEFHDLLVSEGLLQTEHDKYYIRRFLRARQHDLPRAKHMYAEHVQWRRDFKVAEIVKDFKFNERDMFLTLYPQGYHKTDKLGRPIYIQHLGAINIKKLNEITTDDRMLKFHVQEYERCMKYIMPACSKVSGHHVDQTFAIIDVTGVGMSHISGQVKSLLGKITSVDQSNYPEMMGRTFIINAPGMFKFVWAIVKRFLDARTLTKIDLLGSNYQSTLLTHVDKENLPEYLGGSSKATLLDDVGPWQEQAIIDEIDADLRRAMAEPTCRDLEADATSAAAGEPAEARSPAAPAGSTELVETARGPSLKVSTRSGRPPPAVEALANGGDEAFHDSAPAYTRSLSIRSEDEAYYSPRSDSTFSSFTERNSQNLDSPTLSTSRPRLESLEASKNMGSGKQASLAARVRRLEMAIPGLKEKLDPSLDLRLDRGSFTRSSGLNMMGRVEMLEDALEILLTAQEEKLEKEAQPPPEQKESQDSSCGCCTIM